MNPTLILSHPVLLCLIYGSVVVALIRVYGYFIMLCCVIDNPNATYCYYVVTQPIGAALVSVEHRLYFLHCESTLYWSAAVQT